MTQSLKRVQSIPDPMSSQVPLHSTGELNTVNDNSLRQPVFVTQPALPPLDEFIPYLEGIWKSRQVTNIGQYHRELE